MGLIRIITTLVEMPMGGMVHGIMPLTVITGICGVPLWVRAIPVPM
jgi:hypothetical protein